MWEDKHRELMKRVNGVHNDMIVSDMIKDLVPKDPKDEVIFEYTEDYREPDAIDALINRWLVGDM